MSGYYTNDSQIKFKYSFATKEEIETINIKNLKVSKTKKNKKQHNKSHSKVSGCQSYYYTKCLGFQLEDIEPDYVCKTFYAGTICNFNETTESTEEDDSWLDLFNEETGGGSSINNDYCNQLRISNFNSFEDLILFSKSSKYYLIYLKVVHIPLSY